MSRDRWLVTGKPFQGLPSAALGGLGMAGAPPRGLEFGPGVGEPLLQLVDFRLKPVLGRDCLCGCGRDNGDPAFGLLVLLSAPSRTLRRLPRQPLVRLRLPWCGGSGIRAGHARRWASCGAGRTCSLTGQRVPVTAAASVAETL